jgi:hypothetical protein
MNRKRAPSSGQRNSKARVEKNAVFEPMEEKVVRMRRGAAAPDDMVLDRVGQNHPATRAKLDEIEARAFEKSGRLDALRKQAGLPVAVTNTETKQKIISRLNKKPSKKPTKATSGSSRATVSARASTKARAKAKR